LVANSDKIINLNDFINETDIIVRFNKPHKEKIENTGNRTDILFLANTVDLMEDRIKIMNLIVL
jgi:hypothetical protein